jgi:hypothetical protein
MATDFELPSNKMSLLRTNPGLKILLLLYLVLAFGYSVLVPIWEAPDETAHYLYVLILAREKRLPFDSETHEALQPPGYYWPAAQLFRLLDRIDPELIRPSRPPISPVEEPTRYEWNAGNYRPLWGARFLRWLNIIPGVLTLLFIYKGVNNIFPKTTLPLATTALAGLTPQFLHNTAAITNDALGFLVGAVFFWLITVAALDKQTWWQTALIVVAAVLLPFIIKLTVVPMSVALLAAVIWQRRDFMSRHGPWLVGVGILLILSFFGILSLVVLDTDQLIWRTIWLRATYIRPDFFSRHSLWFMFETFMHSYWGRLSYRQVGLSPTLTLWLSGLSGMGLTAALWMLVGNKSRWQQRLFWIGLPVVSAVFLALLWIAGQTSNWWAFPTSTLVVGFILMTITMIRLRQFEDKEQLPVARPIWGLIWLAAILTFLIVFKNTLSTPQYHGRFFFPALGPISFLITAGWYTLLPRQLSPYLRVAIPILLVILNLYVWYDQVIPIYYQPFLD